MLKKEVLKLLRSGGPEGISGGEMGRRLGVSRTAVWKCIAALKEDGYQILSYPNSGYALVGAEDVLEEEELRSHLHTRRMGRKLILLDSVRSTNDTLKKLKPEELVSGLAVLASHQSGGRGKNNTTFLSPVKKGIYMSLYTEPDIPFERVRLLTLAAAVAVCRSLEEQGGHPVISYPNDILLEGKKVCGILSEVTAEAETLRLEGCILGIGIYVNALAEDFGQDESRISLRMVTGRGHDRNVIAARVMELYEQYEDQLLMGQARELLEHYRVRLAEVGKPFQARTAAGVRRAVAQNIDVQGRLVGRDEKGRLVKAAPSQIIKE